VSAWGADFATAAGHKWLCGPWGTGLLYVAADTVAELEPPQLGYRSVTDPKADEGYEYHPGARRFEIGTMNPAPYQGIREAIEISREIGLQTIEDRIRDVTEYFKDELDPDRLLSPQAFQSGIVTISIDSPEAFVEAARERRVDVRTVPVPNGVRACFHALNTKADADEFISLIE
jgi:selenocysteine lyase/cysteine desulfurase